jgi:hypothetical protein
LPDVGGALQGRLAFTRGNKVLPPAPIDNVISPNRPSDRENEQQ